MTAIRLPCTSFDGPSWARYPAGPGGSIPRSGPRYTQCAGLVTSEPDRHPVAVRLLLSLSLRHGVGDEPARFGSGQLPAPSRRPASAQHSSPASLDGQPPEANSSRATQCDRPRPGSAPTANTHHQAQSLARAGPPSFTPSVKQSGFSPPASNATLRPPRPARPLLASTANATVSACSQLAVTSPRPSDTSSPATDATLALSVLSSCAYDLRHAAHPTALSAVIRLAQHRTNPGRLPRDSRRRRVETLDRRAERIDGQQGEWRRLRWILHVGPV